MNKPQNELNGLPAFRSPEWQKNVDAEIKAREAVHQPLPPIPTLAQLAETVQQVKERNSNKAQAGSPDFAKQLSYFGGITREAAELIARRFAEIETRLAILEAAAKPGPTTRLDLIEKRKH
jgi:hypothetical protein